MNRAAFVVACAVLLSGCGSESEDDGAAPSTGGAGGAGGTGGSGASGGSGGGSAATPESCGLTPGSDAPADIAGQWAWVERNARIVVAPGIADPFENATVYVGLLEATLNGDQVVFDGRWCDHYVDDPEAIARTIVPDVYVANMPPIGFSGTWTVDGTVGRLALGPYAEIVGVELDDPFGDELPTEVGDPRVMDTDQDGKPGVTIRITGLLDGEMHVVVRRVESHSGVAIAPDRIEGIIDFTVQENILESEPDTIKSFAPTSSKNPNACLSTFRAVKLDGTLDCAAVVDRVDELFP